MKGISNDDSTAPPQLDYFTPTFEPVYAGFWRRAMAIVVDLVVIGVVMSGLEMAVRGLARSSPEVYSFLMRITYGALSFLAFWVPIWLYFALMESSAWQATLGKALVGIRVTGMNGMRISFLRASGRFAAKLCSAVPLYAGFLAAAFSEQKQALHDLLANTLVLARNGRELRNRP